MKTLLSYSIVIHNIFENLFNKKYNNNNNELFQQGMQIIIK